MVLIAYPLTTALLLEISPLYSSTLAGDREDLLHSLADLCLYQAVVWPLAAVQKVLPRYADRT